MCICVSLSMASYAPSWPTIKLKSRNESVNVLKLKSDIRPDTVSMFWGTAENMSV